jgi:hypothetical protein
MSSNMKVNINNPFEEEKKKDVFSPVQNGGGGAADEGVSFLLSGYLG